MSSLRCCVMFTKPARAGTVKTRLIGRLSAAGAADLHHAFVDDLVSRLRGRAFDLRIAWAHEDGETLPDFGVESFRQVGDDLGARLFDGLTRVARTYDRVAAVGSDHPEIPAAWLDEAFDRLDAYDVVIGPARDGGYYLIAVHSDRLMRGLFTDIDWSSERVLTQTLERCEKCGLDVFLMPVGHDVDDAEDLDRLTRFLATELHDCPSTERLLREWGMLS